MITIKACCTDTVYAELRRLICQNGLEHMVAVRPAGASGQADVFIALGENCVCEPARVLISAPTGKARAFSPASAHAVVTVGLDPRNTLTPSSMLHEGGMAALQRELVSLDGKVIGPREIDLTHLKGNIIEKMTVAAAMMVLSAGAEW